MKRKLNLYQKPKKLYDKTRILEENKLKEKYGLKNKKEIWKADAKIKRIRNLAKELIVASDEEKQKFLDTLKKQGIPVETIADVLSLNKEDWLKRRLQTLVVEKKLVNTPKQARQFIVHKHVSIGGRIVNIPSYVVSADEESTIKLNIVLKKKEQKKSEIEEIKEEVLEEGSNEW